MSGSRDGSAPVRWGILGAGSFAQAKVIPGMATCRDSRVVAIASRDAAKARAAATALHIERAYGTYQALLDDPDIDVIFVQLPNHLHVPWSLRAADAGKHVLCEKPIALSAAQAGELLAARERNRVLIGEAFMVRTHPQWLQVRELVRSGRIGELRLITAHFSYTKHDPDNIRNRVEYGGGGLFDIGCYAVTLARWLFAAEPLDAYALLERDPVMGIDRLSAGLLRFARGQASFTVSTQLVPYQRMHVFGTDARIEIEIPLNAPPHEPVHIRIDDGSDLRGRSAELIEIPALDQYAVQADAFSAAVRGRGSVPVPLEDAIANLTVIDALFAAADSGAAVAIPAQTSSRANTRSS